MKNDSDPNRLLDEVLEESPDFRAAMLDLTLGEVRRRRHRRHWGRGTAAAVFALGLGFLAWKMQTPPTLTQKSPPSPALVQTVASRPLSPSQTVLTRASSVQTIFTAATVVIVQTRPADSDVRELTDDDLLALTAGKPSVLIRSGPHEAQLLVADASSSEFISPTEESRQ